MHLLVVIEAMGNSLFLNAVRGYAADNMQMTQKWTGWLEVVCINLAQNRSRWWAFVKIGMTCILLSITNKMQCYTIFFITVKALHISGGFSAHHQVLKNCTHSVGYTSSLLAATDSVGEWIHPR